MAEWTWPNPSELSLDHFGRVNLGRVTFNRVNFSRVIFDRVSLAESEWSGRIIMAEYDWLAE